MLKIKCHLQLTLQLAQDENSIVEFEDVQKSQLNAEEKLNYFFNEFEITVGDWEGNTGIEIGYTETVDFSFIGEDKELNKFANGKELESIKNEIDDCYELEIMYAEIENEEEIVCKLKEQLLNKTVSIRIMEEIVEDILNYDDEGKILNEEYSDKDNTYSYTVNVLGSYQEFILSIDWKVIKYEEDREDNIEMYNRIIKITNIETI